MASWDSKEWLVVSGWWLEKKSRKTMATSDKLYKMEFLLTTSH
jgi:hypothetical protein